MSENIRPLTGALIFYLGIKYVDMKPIDRGVILGHHTWYRSNFVVEYLSKYTLYSSTLTGTVYGSEEHSYMHDTCTTT